MIVNKIAYFKREIERCWNDEVFCLFIPKDEREFYEVLCEYNHTNGCLYVYHPTQPIYTKIPQWEWSVPNVQRLYMILHRWGLL